MDALKGYTSNVHILKDIDNTRFRLYVCEELAVSRDEHICRVVRESREEGIMCSAIADHLWIFDGGKEDGKEDITNQGIDGFRLEAQDTIAECSQVPSTDGQFILDAFLDALEGSASFALLRSHNALKISPWTWLLPENGRLENGTIAQMNIELAQNNKKLSITTSIRESSFHRLHDVRRPDTGDGQVTTAPGGIDATVLPGRATATHYEYSKAGSSVLCTQQWRISVRARLTMDGIVLPDDAFWVDILPDGTQDAVAWPASLCFSKDDKIVVPNDDCFKSWSRWFERYETKTHEDPLSFAEEWSTTFGERGRMLHTSEVSGHDEMTLGNTSALNSHNGGAVFDVSSPPLTNRPDLQALHGIYPTPPDGLATHTSTQPPTQNEHHPIPNGETAQQPTFPPSDPAPDNTIPLFEGGPDMDGDQPQRNHSIVSSIGPNTHNWNRGSTDDLFGEMDDLEYGREEVGDADFNFFDDPDAEPGKGEVDMQHVSAVEPIAEPSVFPENSPNQPSGLNDTVKAKEEPARIEAQQELRKPEMSTRMNDSRSPSPVGTVHDIPTSAANKDEELFPDPRATQDQESHDIKPLSPFGIRETLLPPPIPASASHQQTNTMQERRTSSFGPLIFNPGGAFAPPSSSIAYSDFNPDEKRSSYDLGPTRVPLTTVSESSGSAGSPASSADVESDVDVESDSDAESLSATSDDQSHADAKADEKATPVTRKRKRTLDTSAYCGPQISYNSRSGRAQQFGHDYSNVPSASQQTDLLLHLTGRKVDSVVAAFPGDQSAVYTINEKNLDQVATDVPQPYNNNNNNNNSSQTFHETKTTSNNSQVFKDCFRVLPELGLGDLVVLSQVVAEQAVTITQTVALRVANFGPSDHSQPAGELPVLQDIGNTFEALALNTDLCDVPSLALFREPLPIQRPQAPQANANMGSQARHPPRPPNRIDPTALGPDVLPLTASFIRANRGESPWEMAPTALSFWEALGLGPVSGPKDIKLFCIAPSSATLKYPVAGFLQNLKAAYEGCKFGSLINGLELGGSSPMEDATLYHSVTFDNQTEDPMATAMQAYWHACADVGAELSALACDEPSRTFVVTIIDPFPSSTDDDRTSIRQQLSACFLNLSKAYRSTAARKAKSEGNASQTAISDIDFKIVPIELIASSSGLVIPTAQQMSFVARELYDRCPPSVDDITESSPLANITAPSVELVAPLPKRISFQLTSDPPADLLHEASVLHVAYAMSADGQWTNVVWHDNTGRYTNSSAFCLQGRSFADVALEIWNRTLELIKAREVIWRIFIVTSGSDGIEISRANWWKDVIAQHTERKQLLSVTLLHFQPEIALSISPPPDSLIGQGGGSGAPTPAATPQPPSGPGGSITSPDAVSAGNGPGTAPPTPAPSEVATSILEADPDAHLIETEDETWGMLIERDVAATLRSSRSLSRPATKVQNFVEALAHSVIIKRGKLNLPGDNDAGERPFPCAGASLIWTLRVKLRGDRPNQGEKASVDEGSARHAEVMLREVMGMYRNLGLLSKVKGLDARGLVPVHIVTAALGAEGLNGLLGRPVKTDEDLMM